MHFAEDIAHLLKLGKAERKVLEALSGTPHNPTYVIRAAKVPRATAYLAFSTLKKRGLAQSKIINGRRLWVESPTVDTEKLLSRTINSLKHLQSSTQLEITHEKDTSIVIHRGAEAMRRVIYRAVALSKSERFYIYQGSNTDHGWDRVIGLKNILKINRLLKKKGIIGESFIPEDYFQATVPHLGTEWRESYIDRMNIVYYLPKEYFQSHAEILIFREQVIVFHLRSEIAVEIRNEEILKMFKQLFDMLKLFARRVDTQNAG